MPATGVIDHLLRPEKSEDLDLLLDPFGAVAPAHPEGFVLDVIPADGRAETHTPPRKNVERRGLLRNECGLTLRQDHDAERELQLLRDRGEIAEEDKRFVKRIPVRVRALPPRRPAGWVGAEDVVVRDDVRVSEVLSGLSESGDASRIVADLLMWIHDADAHGRIMASMAIDHRRYEGPTAPDPVAIEARLRGEARDVYGWSNSPGDRYAEHEHGYTKLLYCTLGSIDFVLADGSRIAMRPGDRLVLPPQTRHSAVVGREGCACVEGKLPP